MHARTLARSGPLYAFIDQSKGFYTNQIASQYRSRVTVTFRVGNDASLEEQFLAEADGANLKNLRGCHDKRGIRANIGNGQSFAAVYALINFMEAFKAANKKP